MKTDWNELEKRLTALEDVEAIKILKYTYAQALDNGYKPDDVAGLFTKDGLWSISGVGGTVKGREAIKKHSAKLGKEIVWGQHNMFAPIIKVAPDGQTATGSFYLLCLLTLKNTDAPKGVETYILAGKYQDKFLKINGKWYFRELVEQITQSSPWSDGWVKTPFTKESW